MMMVMLSYFRFFEKRGHFRYLVVIG